MTFLHYTKNRNTFKNFLETDSELTEDDDFMLKSNRVLVPGEQVKKYLGMVKTKGLCKTKIYLLKLDELIEKLLTKCIACKVVRKNRKKHQHQT